MITADEEAIGALTLFWSMLQTLIPAEVMQEVNTLFDDSKLPRVATLNVAEGMSHLYS